MTNDLTRGDLPARMRFGRPARIFVSIALVASSLALALAAPGAQAVPPAAPNDTWVTNGTVRAVARSADTIYLGGDFSYVGPRTGNFAPIDATTGAPDLDFPEVGGGSVVAAVKDGAGGWYVGGSFTHINGQAIARLAHVLSNGTVDAAFNPAPSSSVLALAVSGTTVYVGGSFVAIGGVGRNRIAALDGATGAAVAAFNPNANNTVSALAVSGSTVYAGGTFTTIGGQPRNRIAALDATTGAVNATFNPNANNIVSSLVASGSTLYAAGRFTTIGGQSRNRLAALDATSGAVNATFNPNANNEVSTLALSGGTLYAGGTFSTVGLQARNRVAAVDAATGAVSGWNPAASGSSVQTLAVDGTTVYVGGNFTSIGGQLRNNLAALSSTTATATSWNPNASFTVQALGVHAGKVYVGGAFSSIGGQARSNVAALDATTGAATSWNPDANGTVSALAVEGSTIYVGGSFSTIGGQSRSNIAALDTSGAATSWNPNANGAVSALAVSGTTVYAGGSFATIGGQTRTNIAALAAGTGSATSWAPNADGTVSALAVSGSTVYAGGSFATIGGQSRSRIAALDASGAATSWAADADGTVSAVAVSGSTVYVGGSFGFIGGQVRDSLAAIDATNGSVAGWTPDPDTPVFVVATHLSSVIAGGSFTIMGGRPHQSIAVFDSAQPTLQVTVNGNGHVTASGIDCPSDCTEEYGDGTVVTLTATVDPGAVFGGWTGDCTGAGTTCDVTMNGFKAVTASFVGPHTLTVTTSGTGTVTGTGIDCPGDCSHTFPDGTPITLTASAGSGAVFDGWSGSCSGATCELTMNSNKNVTATFTGPHTLDVVASGSGTVTGTGINCPGDCTSDYTPGTPVSLTSSAGPGSVFSGWSGDCSGTGACELTMNADKNVTATFTARHTLNVSAAGSGAGTITAPGINCPGDCTQDYDEGTPVTLVASAGASSRFDAFSGDCTGATCALTMNGDRSVTATFVARRTLGVTRSGNGTVTGNGIDCPNDCTQDYDVGTSVTLSAAPASGWTFTGWSGGGCSGTGNCALTMDANADVTATFTNSHTLTVTPAGGGSGSVTGPGISCPGDCTQSYDDGTVVQLIAAPGTTSTFDGWTGSCTGAVCSLTMNADKAVTATFDPGVFRPDASIRKWGTSTIVGADKYTTDGTQVIVSKTRRGLTSTFDVRLENDGDVSDVLVARGCTNSTGYSISYYHGLTNITTQIMSATGHQTASILPRGLVTLRMKIRVKTSASKAKNCSIQVASQAAPTVRDVVKVVVKPT